ncbi:hypothetical protein Hypma_016280 [Hypsizygus marmoreus]|uniref:Uncharacterized protein n=1 Tax=Hypsizygus marmoreus TaxID=39966 RepID=A0A369IZS9_HYPMA|nr:hypothetical protein Hypma_016280 [Hypsizygus marmoreus]
MTPDMEHVLHIINVMALKPLKDSDHPLQCSTICSPLRTSKQHNSYPPWSVVPGTVSALSSCYMAIQ